jgi:hypothetical protein
LEQDDAPRFVETLVHREQWEVMPRLLELETSLEALLRVRDVALNEAANATPFHCANAPGTFAYQHGTWALRNEHVGDTWRIDRSEGVEGVFNDATRTRLLFSNVDVACSEDQFPKPRSRKGSGSERVCEGNLFGHLPHFAPRQSDDIATYYLMVDERGAVELSRPVISGETFSSFVERIFLSTGRDDDRASLPLTNDDAIVEFDPLVARRQ